MGVNCSTKPADVKFYQLTRAPIVAMWADRFSRYCWRQFLRFLACPLTLPQCLLSLFIIFCSTPSLQPSRRRGKGDCHWGEVVIKSRLRLRLLLLRMAPLWVILVIAHWMRCSITYEIRTSRRFSQDWPIDRSPTTRACLDHLTKWSMIVTS